MDHASADGNDDSATTTGDGELEASAATVGDDGSCAPAEDISTGVAHTPAEVAVAPTSELTVAAKVAPNLQPLLPIPAEADPDSEFAPGHSNLLPQANPVATDSAQHTDPAPPAQTTFKIDVTAASFGVCVCGKPKQDHIGAALRCPVAEEPES